MDAENSPSLIPLETAAPRRTAGDAQDPDQLDLIVLGGGADAMLAAGEGVRRGWRVGVASAGPTRPDPLDLRVLDYALRQASRHAMRTEQRVRDGMGEEGELSSGLDWPALRGLIGDAYQQLSVGKGRQAWAGRETMLEGQAAFLAPDCLLVGKRPIRFGRAILGTRPRWSSLLVEGRRDEVQGLDAETLFGLERVPQHLAILGTGPRACIWAQAFRRLGSRVWLVGRETSILSGEAPPVVQAVQAELAGSGISLLLGCSRLEIDRIRNQKVLALWREGVEEERFVDEIFWEPPLEPDFEGLQLDLAEVAVSPQAIEVNDRLQTTNRRILAIGGDSRTLAWPEMVEAEARFAVDSLTRLLTRRFEGAHVARCLWTDPEVTQVGWTPVEAALHQIELATYRADDRGLGTGDLVHRSPGFALVHVQQSTGRVFGLTLVGDQVNQLQAAAAWMVQSRRSLASVAELVPSRPSRFELLDEIARRYHAALPGSRWQRLLEQAQSWWDRTVRKFAALSR